MNKRKILIIIKDFKGGTGTFLSQLVKLKGFEIKTCVIRRSNKKDIKNNGNYFFEKNPGYLSTYSLNPFLYSKLLSEVFWCKKIIIKEKPDLIITIDSHAGLLGILARMLMGGKIKPKILATIHNNVSFILPERVPALLRFPILKFGSVLFNNADEIIFVSHGLSQNFKKLFSIKKKTLIIPCGINLTEVKKLQKEKIQENDKKLFTRNLINVISIGRFEKQKDFRTLIEALSLLNKKKKNLNLILLGDGSQKEMLKKTAEKLGVKKTVHFLGWKKNVFPYLKLSDIFVLCSNYEGFGYVIIEAMSQGLPVISNNPPYGPSEILENGKYGLLIKKNTPINIANEITSLINNSKKIKKYRKCSLERVSFYTEEKMLESYNKAIYLCLGITKLSSINL